LRSRWSITSCGRAAPGCAYDCRVVSPAYPLTTDRLTLRPFAEGDLDDLYAFHSRQEVARFLYWEPRNLAQVRETLAQKIGQSRLEAEGERLVAKGRVIRAGRTLTVCRSDVYGVQGETHTHVATALLTMICLDGLAD